MTKGQLLECDDNEVFSDPDCLGQAYAEPRTARGLIFIGSIPSRRYFVSSTEPASMVVLQSRLFSRGECSTFAPGENPKSPVTEIDRSSLDLPFLPGADAVAAPLYIAPVTPSGVGCHSFGQPIETDPGSVLVYPFAGPLPFTIPVPQPLRVAPAP
jgi:hypothetical protein